MGVKVVVVGIIVGVIVLMSDCGLKKVKRWR